MNGIFLDSCNAIGAGTPHSNTNAVQPETPSMLQGGGAEACNGVHLQKMVPSIFQGHLWQTLANAIGAGTPHSNTNAVQPETSSMLQGGGAQACNGVHLQKMVLSIFHGHLWQTLPRMLGGSFW